MIYPVIIYNVFEYFLKLLSGGGHVELTAGKVKEVEGQILILLGILQILFLGATFVISIYLSHRIAGPLYKLKRSLEDVAKGNFDQRVTFRKYDHFKDLQDTFNDMIQHLSIRRWR